MLVAERAGGLGAVKLVADKRDMAKLEAAAVPNWGGVCDIGVTVAS